MNCLNPVGAARSNTYGTAQRRDSSPSTWIHQADRSVRFSTNRTKSVVLTE